MRCSHEIFGHFLGAVRPTVWLGTTQPLLTNYERREKAHQTTISNHRYLPFLYADVLLGKLNKDISFALRRGTIAQVTTALDAAQRAVEYESALNNEADWDR